MWYTMITQRILGHLLQECSFETLSKIYDIVCELNEAQRKYLRYEFGTTTLIEMIQEEYEYRTQCDDCRKEINLTPSSKW